MMEARSLQLNTYARPSLESMPVEQVLVVPEVNEAAPTMVNDFSLTRSIEENKEEAMRPQEKVFNSKRMVWLVLYIALAIAVSLALLFTLPATGMERAHTSDQITIAPPATAMASDLPANYYYKDGEIVEVQVAPYEETKASTNWFDSVCDWISGIIR